MTTTEATFEQDWEVWHAAREEQLAGPHGWLSLTGLHWLDEAATAYEGLPGTWRSTGDGGVEVTAAGEAAIDGRPVEGTVRLEPVDGAPGLIVEVGERRVEVIRRVERYALRVRDPLAITRTAFTGVPTFPVDERWAVEGRFEPYARSQRLTVETVVEGLPFFQTALGVVRFELEGAEHTLVAFSFVKGMSLHFRDATSGETTYGAGRNVMIGEADADGRVTVDFNRAINLPCAFTAFATCPLPPAGNVLTVAVEAGERTPPRPDLSS